MLARVGFYVFLSFVTGYPTRAKSHPAPLTVFPRHRLQLPLPRINFASEPRFIAMSEKGAGEGERRDITASKVIPKTYIKRSHTRSWKTPAIRQTFLSLDHFQTGTCLPSQMNELPFFTAAYGSLGLGKGAHKRRVSIVFYWYPRLIDEKRSEGRKEASSRGWKPTVVAAVAVAGDLLWRWR